MANTGIVQDGRSYRLTSIDMLRGLVIVIMAIDHVRDSFLLGTVQDPMNQPDVAVSIYLTRWITHFCAPVFLLLAGTSVGLMSARKTPRQVGAFLLIRGLWLIFVCVFVISTATTFSPLGMKEFGGAIVIILQVIWAIGASFVLLSATQFLGARACLYLGSLILLSHNLLDPLWPAPDLQGGDSSPWAVLFYQGSFFLKPVFILEVYPIFAWFGVMLLGFGSAFIFEKESAKRDQILIRVGVSFIVAFVILRASGVYGDPNPWQVHEHRITATILDFMNVTKYPPSLLFLLATLGPMAVLAGYADRLSGWLKDTLVMFGRVPFLFYVAHVYLIHLLAICLGVVQGFQANEFMTAFLFFPEDYGVGLLGVYMVWILVLMILYPICKWFARVKSQRRDWWLSYL